MKLSGEKFIKYVTNSLYKINVRELDYWGNLKKEYLNKAYNGEIFELVASNTYNKAPYTNLFVKDSFRLLEAPQILKDYNLVANRIVEYFDVDKVEFSIDLNPWSDEEDISAGFTDPEFSISFIFNVRLSSSPFSQN